MTLTYALLSLPCWSCDEHFQHFTDLSNHHLAMHERPLPVNHVVTQEDSHWQLCAICAASGCLTSCATCGENHPEHGPGGKGCAAWVAQPIPITDALAEASSPVECPICLHIYPLVLFCTRCRPGCPACVAVRAAHLEPTPALRRMWQVNDVGEHYNDHVENAVCAGAKCVPVEEGGLDATAPTP